MIGKSLDGTWKVGIATAGGLLAEILKKYYGMWRATSVVIP